MVLPFSCMITRAGPEKKRHIPVCNFIAMTISQLSQNAFTSKKNTLTSTQSSSQIYLHGFFYIHKSPNIKLLKCTVCLLIILKSFLDSKLLPHVNTIWFNLLLKQILKHATVTEHKRMVSDKSYNLGLFEIRQTDFGWTITNITWTISALLKSSIQPFEDNNNQIWFWNLWLFSILLLSLREYKMTPDWKCHFMTGWLKAVNSYSTYWQYIVYIKLNYCNIQPWNFWAEHQRS